MQRKAFSLIELIIVVVIMGVVYTLSVTNFQKVQQEEKKVSLKGLKTYLQSIEHEKKVQLLCLDECSNCVIYADNELYDDESFFSDILDESIEIYRYDFLLGIQEEERKVHFNSKGIQEDVCFTYSVNKQGIGDQVLVKYKEKVYDYTGYQSEAVVYDSLEDVAEFKEKMNQELLQ